MNLRILLILFLLICQNAHAGVNFDNTDDLLSCGSSDTLLNESSALTISVWIYPNSIGQNNAGRIVDRTNAGLTEGVALLLSATNAVQFNVFGSTTLIRKTDNNLITPSAWNHVLVTWTASTTATNAKIYINGTEATYQTTTNGASLGNNAADTTRLGNNANSNRTFDGIINEVAIWNSVVSVDDINNLSNSRIKRFPLQVSPSNLKAYWAIGNAGDGSTADAVIFNDLSGTGNNCTGDNGANNTGLTGAAETVLTYS